MASVVDSSASGDLLDSIYCNYPIGTILIWKTSRRNEGQLRRKLHILPPFSPKNRYIYFLIDGQQRLSVLWHFLRGAAASVVNADGRHVDFGCVYFDPRPTERPFIYRKRIPGTLAERVIPVVDLLSSGWRHRVRGHGIRAMNHIEECRRRLLSYDALLVFCETSELTEVRQSFVRINSLGMRIGAVDRAFARAAKFDMRGLVRDARARLKHGFDRVPSTTILQTVALALGGRDVGERAIDAMVSKLETKESERARFHRLWPALREAFEMAADYAFYELGVQNFDFLPSEPMMTFLSLFFFSNHNVRPSRAAKGRLRQWFWATVVGARYTGRGYRPNILADADFAVRLARSPKAKNPTLKVTVPRYKLRDTEYGRPGPVSNAFFILLRLNRPRYLEDGALIPLGEISNRKDSRDKHHIFPQGLLKHYGVAPERFNSILNICYLVARENRSVGKRPPRRYLEDVPRNNRARTLAMRSHFIPSKEGRGPWARSIKRGFKVFIEDRTQLLVRAFERQAGSRLFERD